MRKIAMAAALVAAAGCVLHGGPAWAAADGKALFAAKCSSCHGKDGKGNPAMAKMFKVEPSALDIVSGWTAESEVKRAEALEKGRGKMPAYGDKLSAEERTAIIAFLNGGPKAVPTTNTTRNVTPKVVRRTQAAPASKPKAGLKNPAPVSDRP